jgi:predicted nucleic acid-binding protein
VTLVVDASITLAWLFDDEGDSVSELALDLTMRSGATAPLIWRIEVANGLRSAMRRRRITIQQRDAWLPVLSKLPVTEDLFTNQLAWSKTLALSDQYALTLYDAAYLELAIRTGLTLASNDKDLNEAGRAVGIQTLR